MMMAQVLQEKIPLINKMMLMGESKRLKANQLLERTYWTCEGNTGLSKAVESEDEQEQQGATELLQAVTMLRGGRLGQPKETAETKGERAVKTCATSYQGMQDTTRMAQL